MNDRFKACGAEATGGLALLKHVREKLEQGGYVRFVHAYAWPILIDTDQKWFTTIDGRSYQAFLITADKRYTREESGSIETNDLIIVWHK